MTEHRGRPHAARHRLSLAGTGSGVPLRLILQRPSGHGPACRPRTRCYCSGFLPEFPLARPDERPDTSFREQPRLVPHNDRLAASHAGALYAIWDRKTR